MYYGIVNHVCNHFKIIHLLYTDEINLFLLILLMMRLMMRYNITPHTQRGSIETTYL